MSEIWKMNEQEVRGYAAELKTDIKLLNKKIQRLKQENEELKEAVKWYKKESETGNGK